MNGRYFGKVKVVCDDMMCFAARLGDLEPVSCSTYDPYALSDPDTEPRETISLSEWYRRRDEMQRAGRRTPHKPGTPSI